MEKDLKEKLISQAQNYLVEKPQDPMHGIDHHQRVVNLASQIIEQEDLSEKLDVDIVEVLCWWHDAVTPEPVQEGERIVNATARYLRMLVPVDSQDEVFDGIENHEFGSIPKYLSGKVLQDADKLEILSCPRIDEAIAGIESGELDREKMLNTLASIRDEWLPLMQERYHFEFSKQYHQSKQDDFLVYLEEAEARIKASPVL